MKAEDRLGVSAEARMAAARVAVRSQSERAFALVLDRLLVDTGTARGRLIGFDAAGHEVAAVERGPLDDAKTRAALAQAAALAAPQLADGTLTLPLRLARRPLAIAFLDGTADVEHAVIDEASARAAVGVGNGLHLAEMQARSELLAELAHEIRNPLAGILSFSDLLPDEASELPPKYIHLMANIQEDAQRLKRLVESLLAMVQMPPRALGSVELGELLPALADRFRPWVARRNVTLDVLAEGVVLADRESLALAVANLVVNAISATPLGGQIAVRSRPGPDRESRWCAPGRAFWLEIADSGPGLAPSTVETARDGGLYIARELVAALGGALWAEEGQGGARLVMRLPASAAA